MYKIKNEKKKNLQKVSFENNLFWSLDKGRVDKNLILPVQKTLLFSFFNSARSVQELQGVTQGDHK